MPAIADLPGVPDASFVAPPPQATLQIIRDLSERNAPGAVCFAAGFAEKADSEAENGREVVNRTIESVGVTK